VPVAVQLTVARAAGLLTTEAKGEPVTSFSAPLLSTVNTEMLLESRLATYRRLPEASVVT